ncbi:Ig-like domain-containing protein [Pedobacter frigoris]|uniref:Ig-like domain-containing protein n=1 Tax=Pedobacter frigoris TaxID=2571272 RepID=UPI00293100A8|nr:Ig-like domain-containing protein [Pedobacter frigoris]
MIKLFRFSLVLILGIFASTSCFSQFPYTESFRNSTATGIVFGGTPSSFLTASGASPIDAPGTGFLRLTNAARNQKGYAYNTSDFPSSNGLKVEFEYAIYGGDGADGISFFLFDATADPFVIGGFGGSLGYAQITTTTPISPGVSKGYLAIGLDEFGNFSNNNEGRQGGIGFRRGSITLRGKGDGAALTPDNYRFLVSEHPDELGASLIGNSEQRITDPTNQAYRKIYIELIPNPAGGYNINVYITKGGIPQVRVKIIDSYYYPDIAPENLRYGFASSTGDNTNFHEIRNVAIDLYTRNPIAASDARNVCQNLTGSIDVTANDIVNETGVTIDKSSVDLDPATPGVQTSFLVAGKGTFSVNAGGVVQFVPLAGFLGTATAKYTLKDSNGTLSNVATINLTYVAQPTAASAGPNEAINVFSANGTYVLQGNIPASPNTGLWTQVSGPSTALFNSPTVNNTTVSNLISGVYIFRWTISSTAGCSSSADVQITVNNPPVAINDIATTPLNTPVPILILDNDTDDAGNANINKNSIVIKTQPTNGTLSINYTTGVVSYIPNPGFSGTDNFTYSVKDANLAESNIATVTIVVNKTLVGVDDVANTTVGVPILIHVLDNDPKKTGATVLKSTDPTHGSISINSDGTINYIPNPGYSGKDSFIYRLTNSNGDLSDPITVTVNVKPTGLPDLTSTPLNTTVIIPVKNNDPGKDGTTVIPAVNPGHGSITVDASGNVIYVPSPGFSGKDTFTYSLRTSDGLESNPITVIVNVKPVGSSDNVTTPPSTPITILIKNNDPSNLGTTVIPNTNPSNGTAILNPDGSVTYTPNTDFSGKDSFTYFLSTTDGVLSDPVNVTVIIRPVGSNDNVTTPINTVITIPVKDNDLSKTGTSIVINTIPLHGTVSLNGSGIPVYTPTSGYSGKDSFTYILRTVDGLDSDPITATITIKPVGNNDNATTLTNVPVTVLIKDNDISKAGTNVLINSLPSNGSVTLNSDGSVTYNPNTGFSGKDTYTYVLRTADGLDSDPITVTINVKPTGTADMATTNANVPVVIPAKDNDNGKTGTSILIGTQPLHGTVTVNSSGVPVYTPTPGYSGPDNFTYILRTADGLDSDPIPVTITVKPQVVIPAPDITIETPVNKPIVVTLPIPPGGTVIITDPPEHGTITIDPVTGQPIYTPNPGYSGPDDFTYVIKDSDGNTSSPGKVTVNVKIPAKIGLAKELKKENIIKNVDGTFTLTYTFVVKNYGEIALGKMSLKDDLADVFRGNSVKVTSISSTGTLVVNTNYNGTTVTELLDPSSKLSASPQSNSSAIITLQINVNLDKKEGDFLNTAVVRGYSTTNGVETETFDVSTNGIKPDPKDDGNVSPTEFTPVNLIRNDIFIPGGFSPNNDGINDLFVIENTLGRQISLEVYNRWGNRIYRSSKYENNWGGKTTEGIHIGDEVPAGTYYYIIKIDNNDKRVGYITINR